MRKSLELCFTQFMLSMRGGHPGFKVLEEFFFSNSVPGSKTIGEMRSNLPFWVTYVPSKTYTGSVS